MPWPGYSWLPKKHNQGRFCILIITSARYLRWPYARNLEEPKYNTRKDAEIVLKAYIKFANNSSMTKIKRCENEFEIIDITESINKS